MSKLNDFITEIGKFDEELQKLRGQKNEKLVEVGDLENEKKRFIVGHVGSYDQNDIKAFDIKIKRLNEEIESLDEQLVLLEQERKQVVSKHLEPLKDERTQIQKKHNKTVSELENELFKLKLETMKKFEEVYSQVRELQSELDEYNEIISRNSPRREPSVELKKPNIYAPDYLFNGVGESPVAIQQTELDALQGHGRGRLPYAYILYKMTEGKEIIRDEKEAQKRINEIKKGAN